MPTVTADVERDILEELKKEFPGDSMMQELHLYRRLRYEEVKHLPRKEALHRLLFGPRTETAKGSSEASRPWVQGARAPSL